MKGVETYMMSDDIAAQWWIYLIRTPQNTLYCGVTTNVFRRFQQHQSGKGAKALRGKSPLILEWFHMVGSRSQALRLEVALKKKSKQAKEQLSMKACLFNHEFLESGRIVI